MIGSQKCNNIFVKHPFIVGLSIRLLIMILFPLLLDDGLLLGGVKYTDIDYSVYTDAAVLVQNDKSPFERHTYRYTPFLATILAWGASKTRSMRWFGRTLFCVADAFCGQILLLMRREDRKKQLKQSDNNVSNQAYAEWIDALWWLYNPLPINICTRGSAESFMVLFPVLLTVHIATTNAQWVHSFLPFRRRNQTDIILRAGICGIIHGIAIHSKLYPIIYTPSFMAYFSRESCHGQYIDQSHMLYWKKKNGINKFRDQKHKNPFPKNTKVIQKQPKNENVFLKIITFLYVWVRRILQPAPILFLSYSMFIFIGLTYLGVQQYGREALTEGLLYHFSRLDHRHNYSMYWYGIYLARYKQEVILQSISASDGNVTILSFISRVLFLPQFVLLFQCSMGIAPYDLSLALFLQTYVFVMFNKVITGQYFTWYLCLLPLCASRIQWKFREMKIAFGFLGAAICIWLASAFCLEMKGYSVHFIVWIASILVFGANLNLLRVILLGYKKKKMELDEDITATQKKRKKQQ